MATAAPPAPVGPAHVATVSFLASRAAPTGGFWIALAGGVALARVSQRLGARQGFGASLAAMLETVAIMGPARFAVPLTQAITAPLLGRLEARGTPLPLQLLACSAIRLLHNTATTAFFIWVITGGLDAYAGTYDALAGRVGLEVNTTTALLLTAAGLLAWAAFASTVQVLVYRRGLRTWPEEEHGEPAAAEPELAAAVAPATRARFDPRLVAGAAGVAFVLLLAGTAWPLLAGVAVWLAFAWALSRADPGPVPTGLALAGLIAGSALLFTLVGGLGADIALRRTARAALLVLVATWLRAAAGADGLREVSRRALGRLRRLPSLPEAVRTLDGIGSERRLLAAGRSLTESLAGVRKRPRPVVDAVLGWVVRESASVRPAPAPPRRTLHVRAPDWALLVLAAAPALTLVAG
jgi:hypothetical protein